MNNNFDKRPIHKNVIKNKTQRIQKKPRNVQVNSRESALLAEKHRKLRIAKAKRIRNMIEKTVAVFVFSIISTAILLFAITLILYFNFNSVSETKSLPVELCYQDNQNIVLDQAEYKIFDGEYYVSLKAISSLPGISLIGDVKRMTLSLSESQNAEFTVGSRHVNINGNNVTLLNTSKFIGGDLFIPIDFFDKYLKNSKTEISDKKISLTIPENKYYSLSLGSPTQMPEKTFVSTMSSDYKTNLTKYEQFIAPQDKDKYITLINKDNPLPSDYVPEDLVEVIYTRKDRAYQKLRKDAAMALEAMFNELYAAGFTDVTVTSAYRSYDYQSTLFSNEVASLKAKYGDRAQEKAAESINPPGTSEHQSGLCADLHNLSSASQKFASEDAYKWLISHCADFGFILRYPKNKSDITGIIFEPWHYRYVGRYHAQKIMNSGMCLEEYVKTLD